MSEDQLLKLVALIMVVFLVAPGFLFYTRRGGSKAALRNIAIWVIIALVAAIGFSIFDESFNNFRN